MDKIPIWIIFGATILIVMATIELGFRVGRAAHHRSEDEKESPVSAIEAAVLGLLAFILAFTFGMVSDHYDTRKALVRDEASAIRTAWLRSDFLPEPSRSEAIALLKKYLDIRLAAVQSGDIKELQKILPETVKIQHRLWEIATVNAGRDLNSDVAALYIESLNEVINIHALRISMGMQIRLPISIWVVLYALIMLGMFLVGYHSAIAASRRSWAKPILAISFSLVIVLILMLDRPDSGYLPVTQQPLINLQSMMNGGFEANPTHPQNP